ncbi:hypothetical protein Q8W25_19325 [Shimia thalassica]|uniref:hypothetical protein n=2 Tax=Roseobacteraceae TaxID=2854170 RepID=UPI002733E67D|nr:hypothetical protein [Shimia thalassica]MDP2496190.1 hypothetical protein [Shimia thalassica]
MMMLPDAKREHYTREIVLGRMSMFQAGKDLGMSDTSVARYISQLPEEDKLAILATAMHDAKVKTAMQHAAIVNEFGEDTDKDLKWVLRELKSLLEGAKGDEDRVMQLGALKELRQSLMSLADLHGKLNKKMDIHLNLNESPQFIQLRQIILKVLNNHPAAKHDFLNEMDAMGVIKEPVLVDDRRPA